MIRISQVSKSFGNLKANDNLSFEIPKSKLVGLLGPDGAGKTTLMRMICALMVPDQGEIYIEDLQTVRDRVKIRSIIGYMPQKFSLYPDLSVEQNILFFADLFGVGEKERKKRIEELYSFSRLGPFRSRQAGALSGGMKQKLALSCNLIHTPDYLILDEPTFGVDPVSRQEFWELIMEIKNNGTTVFVSTPYLDEAELFDLSVLMFKGRIIDYDIPARLREKYPFPLYSVVAEKPALSKAFFEKSPFCESVHYFGNELHISFKRDPEPAEWESWITQNCVKSYNKRQASLEDIFLHQISQEEK